MAYSTQRAVSDGTMAYLDLAIGYQSRNDIKVFYNDLPADPETWEWVGTTDKRIAFTPNVPNGVEVLVQRTTRLDRIINVFASGAKFTNVTMDMNFEQILLLTQEAVEGSALSDIFNDVDFHNFKIKNLGTAVDANDAITFGQVQSMSTGAYAAQLAAEAARDLAQLWATKLTTTVDGTNFSAKQYALNASGSATASAASAAAALASQNAAASSATASQTSRLASESARDATFVARDAAVGAAAPATEIYNRLDAVEIAAADADANADTRVLKAGDTMTGDLTVTGTTVAGTLTSSNAVNAGGGFVAPGGTTPAVQTNSFFLSGSARVGRIWDATAGLGAVNKCETAHRPGVEATIVHYVNSVPFAMGSGGTGSSAGGWVATSDQRVKYDRKVIENALDKVDKLTGYTYLRPDMTGMNGVVPRKAGLLAQDVLKVLRETVVVPDNYDPVSDTGDLLQLHQDGVTGLLVNAVKELRAEVNALREQLNK